MPLAIIPWPSLNYSVGFSSGRSQSAVLCYLLFGCADTVKSSAPQGRQARGRSARNLSPPKGHFARLLPLQRMRNWRGERSGGWPIVILMEWGRTKRLEDHDHHQVDRSNPPRNLFARSGRQSLNRPWQEEKRQYLDTMSSFLSRRTIAPISPLIIKLNLVGVGSGMTTRRGPLYVGYSILCRYQKYSSPDPPRAKSMLCLSSCARMVLESV